VHFSGDQFDEAFAETDCWVPSEFRARRAIAQLSFEQLRDSLVERLGELGVPSCATMSIKWARDGTNGPGSPTLIREIASILGCTERDLMCPKCTYKAEDRLVPEEADVESALAVMSYLAGLERMRRLAE